MTIRNGLFEIDYFQKKYFLAFLDQVYIFLIIINFENDPDLWKRQVL